MFHSLFIQYHFRYSFSSYTLLLLVLIELLPLELFASSLKSCFAFFESFSEFFSCCNLLSSLQVLNLLLLPFSWVLPFSSLFFLKGGYGCQGRSPDLFFLSFLLLREYLWRLYQLPLFLPYLILFASGAFFNSSKSTEISFSLAFSLFFSSLPLLRGYCISLLKTFFQLLVWLQWHFQSFFFA